ncbi:MAG: hypothetical protein JMM79_02490 [Candidatus Xiphinematobacter sp.]|nr:MAG: hypothetical protein JMM79_02490 [Candidatus Xiphinematobacter sp.]
MDLELPPFRYLTNFQSLERGRGAIVSHLGSYNILVHSIDTERKKPKGRSGITSKRTSTSPIGEN